MNAAEFGTLLKKCQCTPYKLQKIFALKRKKRISKELKLEVTMQPKVKYLGDRFISQILHLKSVMNWTLVKKFSQIQGDYNALDSKIQLIFVQYNWIILTN